MSGRPAALFTETILPFRSSSLLDLRRRLLHQELEVGVEVALSEQHVVGALLRHLVARPDES